MKITWVNKEKAYIAVAERVIQTQIVLDIGPGIRPRKFFRPQVHICVEPYLPYIEHLRQNNNDNLPYVFLNCTWDSIMKFLPDKSVDSIFAFDVIEHLEKEDGFEFIRQAERVARQQIVIYTPLGFYPQNYDDTHNLDRWGMEGGYWQTHRSGWTPDDFDQNWDLVCCKAYHFVDQDEKTLEEPFGALWAFYNLQAQSSNKKYISSIAKPVIEPSRILQKVRSASSRLKAKFSI